MPRLRTDIPVVAPESEQDVTTPAVDLKPEFQAEWCPFS